MSSKELNLPFIALIVYGTIYALLIKERYSEKFETENNKEENENQNDNMSTIEKSYALSNLKLKPPWIREEASFPIYGNIGVRIQTALDIFGPFKS